MKDKPKTIKELQEEKGVWIVYDLEANRKIQDLLTKSKFAFRFDTSLKIERKKLKDAVGKKIDKMKLEDALTESFEEYKEYLKTKLKEIFNGR